MFRVNFNYSHLHIFRIANLLWVLERGESRRIDHRGVRFMVTGLHCAWCWRWSGILKPGD